MVSERRSCRRCTAVEGRTMRQRDVWESSTWFKSVEVSESEDERIILMIKFSSVCVWNLQVAVGPG